MTLAQLRTLTSVWLDDTSNTYFTTPQVNVWLNQAQRETQKMLLNAGDEYYTTVYYTTAVVDQPVYIFPSDFVKLMRLEYVTSGSGLTAQTQRIQPISRNEQDLVGNAQTGAPLFYYINKNSLQLLPAPDSTYELRLHYAPRVSDMTSDSDIPDAPEDYHELISILAARDGFIRDGRDLSPIELKMRIYKDMMAKNAQQRTQDSPRTVTSTFGGFGAW